MSRSYVTRLFEVDTHLKNVFTLKLTECEKSCLFACTAAVKWWFGPAAVAVCVKHFSPKLVNIMFVAVGPNFGRGPTLQCSTMCLTFEDTGGRHSADMCDQQNSVPRRSNTDVRNQIRSGNHLMNNSITVVDNNMDQTYGRKVLTV